MRVCFSVFSVLSFLLGVFIFLGAKSAIHEIEAGILVLIAALFFVGACIIEAIVRPRTEHGPSELVLNEIGSTLEAIKARVEDIEKSIDRTSPLPPVPGRERYYLAMDGQVGEPKSRDEIVAFLHSKWAGANAYVLKEGSTEWIRAEAFVRAQPS